MRDFEGRGSLISVPWYVFSAVIFFSFPVVARGGEPPPSLKSIVQYQLLSSRGTRWLQRRLGSRLEEQVGYC